MQYQQPVIATYMFFGQMRWITHGHAAKLISEI